MPTEATEAESNESAELETESAAMEDDASDAVDSHTSEDNSDKYDLTEPEETLAENVSDENAEDSGTAPSEGEAETTVSTEPEATEPESTEPETAPEETEPETTEATDTEPEKTEAPAESVSLKYNRSASANIADSSLVLADFQENSAWNVEDVIPKALQSSLTYKDVFPDTDLLYTAYGYNLKEQIVVNAPQAGYHYSFLLNLDSLTAEKNEDGSISFLDADGTPVYEIPIPYMEDDAGVISEDVSFTLSETEAGLVLTVQANTEWINNEDRVFPVKIDPSFTIVSGKALDEIYSVYTMEAAPNDTTVCTAEL